MKTETIKHLKRELAEIKTALDESGTAIGNEHETYSLAHRIKNLTAEREYFYRQTDKARNELAQLKTSVAAMPNVQSSGTAAERDAECNDDIQIS
jgi:phosphodiesterase/alkaline phosphatase D-like protein